MKTVEELNGWLTEHHLRGYWTMDRRGGEGPAPAPFRPYLWPWRELETAMDNAGELVPPEDSFRRFVGYVHPDLGHNVAHTILLGAQLVKPGERPPAHRHLMAAIRFVIRGGGAFTIVNGEEFPMEAGDLITTPSMTWHDHHNPSSEPIVWLDGADGPLVGLLKAMTGDPYPKPTQDVVRPIGMSTVETGPIRPSWVSRPSPPDRSSGTLAVPQPVAHRYPWEETRRVLDLLAEDAGDPYDGVLVRYVNPSSGAATLPTLSCAMQMLRSREKTQAHSHNSTVVYHAFRGAGRTVIDGQTFEWHQGDSFVVPLRSRHFHENQSDEAAYLFSLSDQPVLEALGIYQEEAG